MFEPLLADAPPQWMWPDMIMVMVGLVGLLMIAVLVLTGVEKWKKVFGPHPTIPQPPFEIQPSIEYATVGQMLELKADMHNQLKDMRSYLHETAHENANEMQGLQTKLDGVKDSMAQEGSRRAKNINERVDKIAERLSSVDERSRLTEARTVQIDQKVDRLLERLAA